MGRILKAYDTRFRWLLQEARARCVEKGVSLLVKRAERVCADEGIPMSDALTRVYDRLAWQVGHGGPRTTAVPALFYCDAGLGGLARWLRATGYDARWDEGIDDDALLKRASGLSATILTTDSMLMERRLLRDRVVPAFWMPPTLSVVEQLTLVFREFNLRLRERRCMSCGGALAKASKEALKDRIPPRTYRWLDEYFVCGRCGKLFWHGTHWTRIERQLKSVAAEAAHSALASGPPQTTFGTQPL